MTSYWLGEVFTMAVLAFVGLAALGWIGLIVWWVLIPYLKREGDWT